MSGIAFRYFVRRIEVDTKPISYANRSQAIVDLFEVFERLIQALHHLLERWLCRRGCVRSAWSVVFLRHICRNGGLRVLFRHDKQSNQVKSKEIVSKFHGFYAENNEEIKCAGHSLSRCEENTPF
jgi:hypothetical protein